MSDRKIAVIDLGTNTFNLLIASVEGESTKILFKDRAVVLLGKDGFEEKKITPEAMVRATEALKYFIKIIDKYEISKENIFAAGTSAVRNASNLKSFKDHIYHQTGIMVRVIDGEMEATLIYKGVKQILPLGNEPSLIIDIGGGSVEFVICNQKKIFWQQSFEIGAQRLLSAFHHHEPMLKQECVNMNEYLEIQLASLFEASKKYKPIELIGSSGSFDTLASVVAFTRGVHNHSEDLPFYFTKNEFLCCHDKIKSMNKQQRLEIPGMHPMRVEMIVVSSCLIKFLIEKIHLENIRVSPYSIKEGFLEEITSGRIKQ